MCRPGASIAPAGYPRHNRCLEPSNCPSPRYASDLEPPCRLRRVYPYREVHERITRDLYEELLASGDILFPGHDPALLELGRRLSEDVVVC